MNIYKCDVCKTVYEVIDPVDAQREIVCCGKPARLLKAGDTDAATEKHVPVVSVEGDKLIINVGSVDHPMTPEHWITSIWAEFADGSIERSGLTPNNKPHTEFDIKGRTGEVTITNIATYMVCGRLLLQLNNQ